MNNIKSYNISECSECKHYINESSWIGYCLLQDKDVFPYHICNYCDIDEVNDEYELRPLFRYK